MTVIEISVFFLAAITGVVIIGGIAAMRLGHKRNLKS